MKNTLKCNFCGNEFTDKQRGNLEVILIKSSIEKEYDIRICDACITDCSSIIQDTMVNKAKPKVDSPKEKQTPKLLKSKLDEWIIGQDKAKKDLAIALYSHYKRINNTNKTEVQIEKSNVMLVGKSGTGKTSLIKALAKQLDIPVVFETSSNFSNTGYIGRDVEDILKHLIRETKGDIQKAQTGIVVMDEIDKIRRVGGKLQSGQKDVNGEGVQQSILTMLEGNVVEIHPERNERDGKIVKFDTSNVLFILAGAFEGIEDIVDKRLKKKTKKSSIGFDAILDNKDNSSNRFNNLITQVEQEDLKEFGMMPELLGRVPIVTALEELSIEALEAILTQPKDALIKQYTESLKLDNIELEITPEAINKMAIQAKKKGTEARALRSVVENVLKEALYEGPSDSTITKIIVNPDLTLTYERSFL